MKFSIQNIIKNLQNNGYATINEVISEKLCDQAKLNILKVQKKLKKNLEFNDEASLKGQEIIRDLPLRSPDAFLRFTNLKIIMKVLKNIFNDHFILDNMMASNSINVGSKYDRKIHIDSQIPVNQFNLTTDVVAMIYLDDFKIKNGATKAWPGSHKSGIRIHHEKKINKKKLRKPIYLVGKKGSVSFMLGQTWHQVGTNLTQDSRWAIFLHYKRWWMKPSTDFTKCGKTIFKKLNNENKKLFGFTSISPQFNLKNKIKNIYMIRNVRKVSKDYIKALKH